MKFLKKLKIELTQDPAIPFLGMYQKETKRLIQKDILNIYLNVQSSITYSAWDMEVI